jgi:hypothetical protein
MKNYAYKFNIIIVDFIRIVIVFFKYNTFYFTFHVDRHGHFTLKQLKLPVLNEMHTNSYTGPRLT